MNIDYTLLKNKFGTEVKRIRTEKGFTVRALAAKCDMDDSQLSKIENGKWDVQLSTIFILAKGLGIEAKDLLNFSI